MEQQIERQTAYKIWLSSLNNKSMTKQEGEFSPSYIQLNDKKITRINIIAAVIQKNQKEDGSFSSITLDDGSAQIRAKVWKEGIKILHDINIGNYALVFGKIREYNDELYIMPEIVKKQDNNSFLIRQHELFKEYGKPELILSSVFHEKTSNEQPGIVKVSEEKVQDSSESKRQKILNIISSLDTEIGANVTEVINKSSIPESEAEKIINDLLQEGEIFKISNDRIKVT